MLLLGPWCHAGGDEGEAGSRAREQAVAWLVEAALHYVGKAVSVPTLSSLAVLYPFVLDQPLGYLASKSPNLEVRSEGAGNQFVCIHPRW